MTELEICPHGIKETVVLLFAVPDDIQQEIVDRTGIKVAESLAPVESRVVLDCWECSKDKRLTTP